MLAGLNTWFGLARNVYMGGGTVRSQVGAVCGGPSVSCKSVLMGRFERCQSNSVMGLELSFRKTTVEVTCR